MTASTPSLQLQVAVSLSAITLLDTLLAKSSCCFTNDVNAYGVSFEANLAYGESLWKRTTTTRVAVRTKPVNQEQKLAAEILKCRVTSDNRLDLLVKTFQSIVRIVQKVVTGQLLNHSPLFTKWVPVLLEVCAHSTREVLSSCARSWSYSSLVCAYANLVSSSRARIFSPLVISSLSMVFSRRNVRNV